MAMSGLEIYKLLKKSNCRECGFPTCLAFALSLAKKAVALEKCPHVTDDTKKALEASTQPPIKLVRIGADDKKIEIGNESVLFRHEEKFHHPTAVGIIVEDSLSNEKIKETLKKIGLLKFERIGQLLAVDLIAIKQTGTVGRFVEVVKLADSTLQAGIVLMSDNVVALENSLSALKGKYSLIYAAGKNNLEELAILAKNNDASLTVHADNLDDLGALAKQAVDKGASNIVLDINKGTSQRKMLWDLIQIRRQALKKSTRSLGYPVIVVADGLGSYEQIIEVGDCIVKYASIVLLRSFEPWAILSLLTLRQNIFTDPQKPLQIEPKLYSVGAATEKSPLLVTTNFSLTYYTVLGEIEASKVPAYILSVDTEGMSVLTAWAAEKFTPEKITESLEKSGVAQNITHRNLILPGYVAVMSGDVEEESGWKIIVGPKEAAGLPAFLKNLS